MPVSKPKRKVPMAAKSATAKVYQKAMMVEMLKWCVLKID